MYRYEYKLKRLVCLRVWIENRFMELLEQEHPQATHLEHKNDTNTKTEHLYLWDQHHWRRDHSADHSAYEALDYLHKLAPNQQVFPTPLVGCCTVDELHPVRQFHWSSLPTCQKNLAFEVLCRQEAQSSSVVALWQRTIWNQRLSYQHPVLPTSAYSNVNTIIILITIIVSVIISIYITPSFILLLSLPSCWNSSYMHLRWWHQKAVSLGLEVNWQKKEFQAIGSRENEPLTVIVLGQEVAVVEGFVYLSSLVHSTTQSFPDISQCHCSCVYAKPRQPALEAKNLHFNQAV